MTDALPDQRVPDLPGEEWRPWDEFWAVSNMGRFKALARTIETPRGLWRSRERLLKLKPCSRSDRRNLLARYQRENKVVTVSIYRAMWTAFIGELKPSDHIMCDGPICLANLTKKVGHSPSYRD